MRRFRASLPDVMDSSDRFDGRSRFEIIDRLGAGGGGQVHLAFDRARGIRVAMKTLGRVDGDAVVRFKKEFRSLQALDHPNVVALGELFENEGEWFFTMEHVEGVSILDHVRDRGLVPDEDAPTAMRPAEGRDEVFEPFAQSTERAAVTNAFDEMRLRAAFGQLAYALTEIHAHGLVHRDVKPTNVLVRPDGRVTLIDFGLVTNATSIGQSTELRVLGTVAYMAPEQAAETPVTEAADWYAFGATLYHALTGDVPFVGAPLLVLARKQSDRPLAPGQRARGIPADLESLCVDLLAPRVTDRPTGADVLARLGLDAPPRKSHSLAPPVRAAAGRFVGRAPELDELDAELALVRGGSQRAVAIVAESGLGKSAMIRAFVERVTGRDRNVLVLAGACFEHENVPFKALDGVLERLSRWLKPMPRERIARLLPADMSLLERAFPALQQIPSIRRARFETTTIRDPRERRHRVVHELRELLGTVSRETTLVIVVDDLQWSDDDSHRVVLELMRTPNAPPCLLLFALRPTAATEPVRAQASMREGGLDALLERCRRIELGPLSPSESIELAESFVGDVSDAAIIRSVAASTEGNPFLLESLFTLRQSDERSVVGLDLDSALERRLDGLSHRQVALLRAICVAGARLPVGVAAEASSLVDIGRDLKVLRLARLIRTSGPLPTDHAEPYHDRIRVVVLKGLVWNERVAMHLALARALESHRAPPETIARHYRAANDPATALPFVMRAAEEAFLALAFETSARLYEEGATLAAELGEVARARECGVGRASALASAGHGREAADAYLDAARDAAPEVARNLRRLASERLLLVGRYVEGLEVARRDERELGIDYPPTPRRALLRMIWLRIRLRVRGYDFEPRRESEIPAHVLARIDAHWSIGRGLLIHDPMRAQVFIAETTLLALDAGEPLRIGNALAWEALSLASESPGDVAGVADVLRRVTEIGARFDDPFVHTMATFISGYIDYVVRCDWRAAIAKLASAERDFRSKCAGAAFESSQCITARCICSFFAGEWGDHIRDSPRITAEAFTRGDLAVVQGTKAMFGSLGAALDGDYERAIREIDESRGTVDHVRSPIEEYFFTWAAVRVRLCEGATGAALRLVDDQDHDFVTSLMLRTPVMRFLDQMMKLSVVLAALEVDTNDRAVLARRAGKLARTAIADGTPPSTALGTLALAALAVQDGAPEKAQNLLARAETLCASAGMEAMRVACRARHGRLLGGVEGGAMVEDARAWFAAQGARNLESVLRMLAPGFERVAGHITERTPKRVIERAPRP